MFAVFLEGDRSGIFARRGARMFALRLGGDPAPGGGIFDSFWSVAASGQRVVFGASLGDETFRIVLGRRGNLRNVVQTGDEVRGGGKIASIGRIALHGSTVVFEAVLPAGDPAGDLVLHALVAKRGRRPVVLVREGDPSALGGTIAFLRALAPLSATRREVLLTAQLAGASNGVVLLAVPVRPGG